MRGVISDLFSILLANVFIVSAAVLYYEGTRSFRGWPNHWGTGAALIAVTAATFYYFGIVHGSIIVRVILISVILAAMSWLTAWTLLRKISHTRRLTYWLTGSLFATYGTFMAVRAVIVACRPEMQDLFAPSILQALTFLVPLLLGILWTFGFFILNSERLEMDPDRPDQRSAAGGSGPEEKRGRIPPAHRNARHPRPDRYPSQDRVCQPGLFGTRPGVFAGGRHRHARHRLRSPPISSTPSRNEGGSWPAGNAPCCLWI